MARYELLGALLATCPAAFFRTVLDDLPGLLPIVYTVRRATAITVHACKPRNQKMTAGCVCVPAFAPVRESSSSVVYVSQLLVVCGATGAPARTHVGQVRPTSVLCTGTRIVVGALDCAL